MTGGTLFTVNVVAASDAAAGDHIATATAITLIDTDLQKVNADDTEATITVTPSVAIADVKANTNGTSATYNLQGVQVGTNYKGVIIRDGKKLLQR